LIPIPKLIKLINLIGGAESSYTSKIVMRLLRPLAVSLGHASSLEDDVRKYSKVRGQNQCYHPQRLTPTRGILAPNQVAKDQRSTMTAKIRVDLWTSRIRTITGALNFG
jgi:hypothetical protein